MDSSTISVGLLDQQVSNNGFEVCQKVMMPNGCSIACASKLHNLSEADIWVTSQHFKRLGSKQQRQWILDYLHLNTPQADKTATVHMLCGKTVCLQVWLAVLELSMSRYYEVRRLFLEGAHQIEGPANLKLNRVKLEL